VTAAALKLCPRSVKARAYRIVKNHDWILAYGLWTLDSGEFLNKKGICMGLLYRLKTRGTQRQFSENICSEDDFRSRIFGIFVVKFLACLSLLGFSNI